MRFLCIGMGAIGTYVGGSLASAGHDVVFVERSGQGDFKEINLEYKDQPPVVDRVFTVNTIKAALDTGRFEAALLAVKSFDTPAVIAEVEPFQTEFPPLVCLQNGVENEDKIAAVLGEEKIIGASVTSAIRRIGPGNAVVEKERGIGLESIHPLSAELISLFNEAGVKTAGYPDRKSLKWSKMLTNLQANALPAILNWTPVKVLSTPSTYAIECAALREATEVMKALNIAVVNLPGTPVKPWVYAMTRLPEGISRPLIARLLGAGRGGKMPSLHIDLYAGRKQSEVVFLNGAVARFAAKLGLHAPVNEMLSRILREMAGGDLPFDKYNDHPERIQNEIMEHI